MDNKSLIATASIKPTSIEPAMYLVCLGSCVDAVTMTLQEKQPDSLVTRCAIARTQKEQTAKPRDFRV